MGNRMSRHSLYYPSSLHPDRGMSFLLKLDGQFLNRVLRDSDALDTLRQKEEEHLALMGRNDLCFCGSGFKQKWCHGNIAPNSLLADLLSKYALFDKAVGQVSLCKTGCGECCSHYFYVSIIEYFAIKNYLLTQNVRVFEAYIQKAKQQVEILQSQHPNEYKKLSGQLSLSHRQITDEGQFMPKSFLPCIFLNQALKCSVYQSRPFICRMFGSIASYSNCDHIDESMLVDLDMQELQYINQMDYFQIKRADGTQAQVLLQPKPLFLWFARDGSGRTAAQYNDAICLKRDEYIDRHVAKFR